MFFKLFKNFICHQSLVIVNISKEGLVMAFTKENTLKLMEEINDHRIDIRNTIENADELDGIDSIYIFDKNNRMYSYKEFAEKRDYKFNFLSDRFFEILYRHYIPNNGIFIALAKGKTVYHDKDTPSDYIIKTATAEEKVTTHESYNVAWHYGIKISNDIDVEFACVFGAHACGYGGVRVFKTIGEDTWNHHQWSINNIVNYMAVPMVYDEIVFDD